MNMVKTFILLAAMTALFMGAGWLIGGQSGAMIALVIAAGMNVVAWWNSDKMVLRMHNAQEVTAAEAPALVNGVQRLAQRAGLPMPKVYLIHSDQPNAFATGRSPENAAVAATTGIMRILNQAELDAVMAHELAHVQNRDTLTMTIAATFAGAIGFIAQFGMFMGSRDRPGGGIGALLVMILGPLAAMLVQSAISRTREYSADRRGAEICGNPRALASALAKISRGAAEVPLPSADQNPATAHMFIMNPLSGGGLSSLFSTHPDAQLRIDALIDMERNGMGGGMGSGPGAPPPPPPAGRWGAGAPDVKPPPRRWGGGGSVPPSS